VLERVRERGQGLRLDGMSTIYCKTDKGQAEIETRAFGLSPRLRQTLILVDGRKTESDLTKLIPADPAFALSALLAEGFIDVACTVVDLPLEPVAAPHQPAVSVDRLKREAARFLIDKLGPSAEGLAIKLEGARTLAEVQPLLAGAAQTLRSVGRNPLADEFIARFVTPLQS
jgi:hypothetical protein